MPFLDDDGDADDNDGISEEGIIEFSTYWCFI